MLDTMQAAKARVAEKYPDAQFLTEATPGKNVLLLKRHTPARGKPYMPTFATVIGPTPSGRAKVLLWGSGKETTTVNLDMLFTVDNDWCLGKPIASHMICHEYIEGVIYWQRHRYVRRYDRSLDSREVEELVAQDWQRDPGSFAIIE